MLALRKVSASRDVFNASREVIPGGVNSPVRSWRAVGGEPVVIARGAGREVFDEDGRAYVDLVGSWGPLILGHAHPAVVAAITAQAPRGTSFGAPTALELDLARMVVGALPSVEQVRLVSSGTEATMSALRLARGATGRDRILKFEGCYHGHVDSLLVKAGSGALTLGVPDSPGVPGSLAELTLVAQYNDIAGVRSLLHSRGSELAAVIVEPVAGNMGVVPPAAGFLEVLREEATRAGVVLVFDEVITGFRIGPAGAQGCYGITPDLTCLGKVLGGGMPLAAVGGSRALMQQLAPVGPVYQAGTLSGNPVSVAAGLATLRALETIPRPYEHLDALGAAAEAGLTAALVETGVTGCVNRVGSMMTLFLGIDSARSFAEVVRADTAAFARFFRGMLDEGYYLPPSQFEAMFWSLAHDAADVEGFVRAARSVLRRTAA
jgi:glutamate-1-semialdehyde 2,1-aminomutase